MAAQDRAGLKRAVLALRNCVSGKIHAGGHSYGGRQASMLAAEEPELAASLLLLSYPLHPPKRPQDRRTAHFARLSTPTLFIHGTRDPFGSIEEMRAALQLIAGPHELVTIDGTGHDLGAKSKGSRVAGIAVDAFRAFTTS
jgi:predicted alpha/beta-hydrolase family hydrolase